MRRFCWVLLIAGIWSCRLLAQDSASFQNIQVHGFATQAVVYSNANNYLGMNTSSGNLGWTEAAVNLNDSISDNLPIGAQFHITRVGAFGGINPDVDWALVDYKANRWVGVRAGKVKIRWGLYNDTQDADPGYLWSLLPEPIYAIDWRATNLSQLGGEVYGKLPIARKFGELSYSAYYGYYYYAPDDGHMEGLKEQGLDFSKNPSGVTPGFDLRWKTPARGLKVGGSLMLYNAKGSLAEGGSYRNPLTYWPTVYAQYDYKKLSLSYQHMKLVQWTNVLIPASGLSSSVQDQRAWFAMAGYRVTDKLQLGVYHTRYVLASADEKTDPSSYYRDWVVSGRYDINSHWYSKLEGHAINGTGLGFYTVDNPNGVKPKTKVVVAKFGFVF